MSRERRVEKLYDIKELMCLYWKSKIKRELYFGFGNKEIIRPLVSQISQYAISSFPVNYF